ncbi:Transmembrane protein TauE-like [Propionibacterium ruminifibrarum]|uniref:Probable membrane transporter protein n=1 Tax=Propionibacterium ruminifibrarum TaxID=1962131 RepID=A0A375I511_9ACTN|nr:sulfite exporter TauE/SafE family protein [Propionibacterium ruminifibrarum]SPF68328.1 Transmembrane protein TauE-like [Propionibacterium ruminifibrarum]
MKQLVLLAAAGLAAQLIDGSLGMGYGVTSTSVLLAGGLTPATASASVHMAELGTTVASGVSHWRLRNVDWWLVLRLGVPGAVGAFLGATVLSSLSTEAARPVMALLLVGLGLFILFRSFRRRGAAVSESRVSPHGRRFLVPLGLLGGFVDATGGGGWGPVSTTALVSAGRTSPRTVIGSVDTSEFLVSLAASAGFIVGLGGSGVRLTHVLVLLAGGLVAAPIAAWLVSRIPPKIMGALVGGAIVMTNLGQLFSSLGLPQGALVPAAVVLLMVWAIAVLVVATDRSAVERSAAPGVPQVVAEPV